MSSTLTPSEKPATDRPKGIMGIFAPDPPAREQITDPLEAAKEMTRWRTQILISSMVGYALFYFVRKNLGFAMPGISEDLGITKAQLGLFLTAHGVVYGVSKFANGFLGDRANARVFMITGLLLSAAANYAFGLSSVAITMGIFWVINGWVQGMGFPPCARLMTHWFSPKELATKMAVWNMSHSIGAGIVSVLCGYLVVVSWRLCFFVPATLAVLCCVFLWFTLRDTPQAVGLPEPEDSKVPEKEVVTADGSVQKESFWSFLMSHVFNNPFIWIVAVANFFVYVVRFAVLDWGPTFLYELKGYELHQTGWILAAFEMSGLAGMLLSGWITDRFFGGRGSRTCLVYMALCTVCVYAFLRLPSSSVITSTVVLCICGFLIYGPQCLVGIIAANLATKRAAATAVGLTGIFGYLSTIVSGWGLGLLVDKKGWEYGLEAVIAFAIVGTLLFAIAWPARAHGYAENR